MTGITPPTYFDAIARSADADWRNLEASSWKNAVLQLFSEIQSPQHVLSELLQNADDAGARWTRATIQDGVFIFEHDGQDFDADQLQALCRFGVSSKPQLRTIGFRGIGFKSVFSFGEEVRLYSPSLSIRFPADRFTVPEWIDSPSRFDHTRIEIPFRDETMETRADKELELWRETPTPLIFFNNIRRLDLKGTTIERKRLGPGPTAGSEWVQLSGTGVQKILHVVSEEAPFPEDALTEIAQERRVNTPEELNIHGCRVELAMYEGRSARLYVVLPTAVFPEVPFSSNAPYVQDPARKQIKDPDLSPTNRWLLRRVGELAAETMLGWLQNDSLSLRERAEAYRLLPDPPTIANQVTHHVSREIATAFWTRLADEPIVMTVAGELVSDDCASVPEELHAIWPPDVLLRLLDPDSDHLASSEIRSGALRILGRRGRLTLVYHDAVITELRNTSEPVPNPGYLGLEKLWSYVYQQDKDVVRAWALGPQLAPIVPVEDEESLWAARDLLVLRSRSSALTESDLHFLARYCHIVDPGWPQHLSTSRDGPEMPEDRANARSNARTLLARLKLDSPTGLDEVIDTVAKAIFTRKGFDGDDARTLTWIAARTNSSISNPFRLKCEDGEFRAITANLLIDVDGSLSHLLPEDWAAEHLISDSYEQGVSVADSRLWRRWLTTRAGVSTFPVPQTVHRSLHGRPALEAFCVRRGGRLPERIPYQSPNFVIKDVDFDDDLWDRWKQLAEEDPENWVLVVRRLAQEAPQTTATPYQVPQTQWHLLDAGTLVAGWVERLRDVACLVDTQGIPAFPAELMRITPQSASLQGIERFVHPTLDRDEVRWLLDLLGIRTDPSPEIPLNRLGDLSRAQGVPVTVVANLYQVLDRLAAGLSGEDLRTIRDRFQEQRLILAENNTWQKSSGVVRSNDARIGGILSIHPDVANLELTLWDRIGVPKRATVEQVIESLTALPCDERIEEATLPVVRDALTSNPEAIWRQCNGWADLSGYWRDRKSLRWSLREIEHGRGLFAKFRQQVADLTMIPETTSRLSIESDLPPLESALERRVVDAKPLSRSESAPAWLRTLSEKLQRVPHPDDPSARHPEHKIARRLEIVVWQPVTEVSVAPWMNGQIAGEKRRHRALWSEDVLYVVGQPTRHHDELVQTLGSRFRDPAIKKAITACVGRAPDWIDAYLKEHFELLQIPEPESPNTEPVTPSVGKPELEDIPTESVKVRPSSRSRESEDADRERLSNTSGGRAPEPEADHSLNGDFGASVTSEGLESEDRPNEHRSQTPGNDQQKRTSDRDSDDSTELGEPTESRSPTGRLTPRYVVTAFLKQEDYVEGPDGVLRSSVGSIATFESDVLHALVRDQTGSYRVGYWVGDRPLEDGLTIPAPSWAALFDLVPHGYLLLPAPGDPGQFEAHLVRHLNDRIELSPTHYFIRGSAKASDGARFSDASLVESPDSDQQGSKKPDGGDEKRRELDEPSNRMRRRAPLIRRVLGRKRQ